MKRRQISVEEESWLCPKAGEEVRDLLQRLVEIDSESRRIIVKMTSLIAKDDKIESYVYRRIDDPKSSRMWELIVQLVGMRNVDQIIMNEEEMIKSSNKSINVEDGMNGVIRNDAFKVKNLLNGTESEVVVSTTKTTSSSSSR
ncbi:unnamed protein product [Amaranthus hypochondriacus]